LWIPFIVASLITVLPMTSKAVTITFDGLPTDMTSHQDLTLLYFFGGEAQLLYLDNLTFSVRPVPEPTTTLLFGLGAAGLAVVARRKRSWLFHAADSPGAPSQPLHQEEFNRAFQTNRCPTCCFSADFIVVKSIRQQ
jgi:hypothetical protein